MADMPNTEKSSSGRAGAFDTYSAAKSVIHSVNRLLSSQEQALAAWEAEGSKQEGMERDIKRMRAYHDALSDWMREFLMLEARGIAPQVLATMLERLRRIGRAYGDR
ncbi:MAG: hypothetical protein U0R44_03470 [Candidatus Micrarchaeia archaeon]